VVASTRTASVATGRTSTPKVSTRSPRPICCPAIGLPAPQPYGFTAGPSRRKDHLFFSDSITSSDSRRCSVRQRSAVTPRRISRRACAGTNFDEDRTQVFDGMFVGYSRNGGRPRQTSGAALHRELQGVSDVLTFNAQASRGFRLGGINDPLNKPICSPSDTLTFGGETPGRMRPRGTTKGMKIPVPGGPWLSEHSAFYMDIKNLQLNLTLGHAPRVSCSRRQGEKSGPRI